MNQLEYMYQVRSSHCVRSEDLNKIANISNLYIIKVVVVVSLPAIISS